MDQIKKGQVAQEAEIKDILRSVRSIAVVGLSKEPTKTSHAIANYLQDHGYRIIPVNPSAGVILGERCYRSLGDIVEEVDLVNVFRPKEQSLEIVRQTAARGIHQIWFQPDTASEEAIREAVNLGLCIVPNRCIYVEYQHHMRQNS